MNRLRLDIKKIIYFLNRQQRHRKKHKQQIKQVLKKLREREKTLLEHANAFSLTDQQKQSFLLDAQITHHQRKKGLANLKNIR